jgi:peptide/nickel transport system ATP-binding protein
VNTHSDIVLSVQNLSVSFATPDGVVRAVTDLSFDLHRGETLSIVGESGSGKSVTASSIMRLNNSGTATTTGKILLNGVDILTAHESDVRALRGREVAMVFQDPMSALNPYYTVGAQIDEAYFVHHPKASKSEARAVTLNMLRRVGIPNPDARVNEYPHQFSGGMRQRIVIAIALINNPSVLIADEPTTALDVTVQAQILDLMMELQQEFNMAIILITHDLGVVAEVAQEVIVMYGGRVVEQSSVEALFAEPVHPYAAGLLNAVTSLENTVRGALQTIPGAPPSMIAIPSGCSFHPRCEFNAGAGSLCITEVPLLRTVGSLGSQSACHLSDQQLLNLRPRKSA